MSECDLGRIKRRLIGVALIIYALTISIALAVHSTCGWTLPRVLVAATVVLLFAVFSIAVNEDYSGAVVYTYLVAVLGTPYVLCFAV